VDPLPHMRTPLTLMLLLGLAACAARPPLPGAPPPGAPPAAGSAGTAQPPATAHRPAPQRPARMGPAASALLGQAHSEEGHGELVAAGATLERALRIEPDNPLLWVELGRLQLKEGNAGQADAMGRKALALAGGDGESAGAAWALIADSLRARNRNAEAADADRRAAAFTPR